MYFATEETNSQNHHRSKGVFVGVLCTALGGCAMTSPKYENGQYLPPPSEHALSISLEKQSCDPNRVVSVIGTALLSTVVPALANYGYDQFVNWLDNKAANLSSSSSGIATTPFYYYEDGGGKPKPMGCLILKRAEDLTAKFELTPIGINAEKEAAYWHMTPSSLEFKKSEAKEGADQEKSVVIEIAFATPSVDGKLADFFVGTFDLGKHKAGPAVITKQMLVGQDSGPIVFPKPNDNDRSLTMKITASVVEQGEGRDWIRGVTNSLREKEQRDQILKQILDAIGKALGKGAKQ